MAYPSSFHPRSLRRPTNFIPGGVEATSAPYSTLNTHTSASPQSTSRAYTYSLSPLSEIYISKLASPLYARKTASIFGSCLLKSYQNIVKDVSRAREPGTDVIFMLAPIHGISSPWETMVVKAQQDVEKAKARMWLYENPREALVAVVVGAVVE
ncbi:arginyl-tRNA synthetase [Marasmius crinis-equi]|uniref:Arginyl-tRNA synthetase n=1 Tax=Marasmius crinis-equi TaxID=585013 RepID=A0ABR3ERX6_9AGAR